jgi:type 1 glutamine amidotransferase
MKTPFVYPAVLAAAALILPAQNPPRPAITEIRSPDRLSPEVRQRIEDALPKKAYAKPKKARKLLVMDLQVNYNGHRSIPHANLAVDLMGKKLGIWQATFSNEMSNLKWDKIRQFDAIYLNNTVGPLFNDPEIRESLLRFIREGGGLIGNHGSTHCSMDWPEFTEMIGGKNGPHRDADEKVTIKLDDPKSPLTRMFNGAEFVFADEYFRFPGPPYSREKLHVLMSIDVEKTDMNQGRDCKACIREDNDYAISWIRSYGKGRVFYCSLGHNPNAFWTPELLQHFLAGIQFALGDLKADTTPSAPGGRMPPLQAGGPLHD